MTMRSLPAITAGDARLTPEASALELRLPFGRFAWNRPVAVLVEREGRVERVRIVDVTRIVQIALWAVAVLAWLAVIGESR
jgi:hypothetical protein